MRIGELAEKAGVPVATIRYYEQEGLLPSPSRSAANYRLYGDDTIKRLAFIVRCRSLDINVAELRQLLKLTELPEADCREVDAILDKHIDRVRQQRRSLAKLEKELVTLRQDCHPSLQVQGCGILRDSKLVRK